MAYETGYGKPPKHTQFKKGESGNPKGRPKADARDPVDIVLRALAQKVRVTENGRRKSITKLEAAFTQLMNQAAKGDPRAMKLLMATLQNFEVKPSADGNGPLKIEIVRFSDSLPEK